MDNARVNVNRLRTRFSKYDLIYRIHSLVDNIIIMS